MRKGLAQSVVAAAGMVSRSGIAPSNSWPRHDRQLAATTIVELAPLSSGAFSSGALTCYGIHLSGRPQLCAGIGARRFTLPPPRRPHAVLQTTLDYPIRRPT